LDFLEKRYSRPVLGIIPYFRGLQIAQEDSVYLDERPNRKKDGLPDICVIRLPRISNYDDFDPLEQSCNVRYIASADELGDPDLVILPGTKSTMADMDFLQKSGLAKAIVARSRSGTPVIGICGGYQMLGKTIRDPGNAESGANECRGLGLLDAETIFEPSKITTQVKASANAGPGLLQGMGNITVTGYEIHMGRDTKTQGSPAFNMVKRSKPGAADGCVNKKGTVFGTYIHGLFDNADFTGRLIENICSLRGLACVKHVSIDREKSYDELADIVRKHINMDKIYDIIAGG
jgi:adenosylcobyric acid synthase